VKKYLEITEIVSEEETAEFIRSEITDKTKVEIADIQKAMEDVMSGKHYRLITHYCGHDENKSCQMDLIKEV